jgi:CxxC motif-containing protein (DUF1111 family)
VIWLGAVGLIGLGAPSGSYTAPAVQAPAAQVILGESVFNTAWASAGTPGVARRGLGPLFNAASCAMCHANGGGGKGPAADGPTPTALVIQLGTTGAEVGAEEDGDPLYGRVFNTASVDGVRPEGVVIVRYRELEGRYYLDGARWRMRVPQYQLTGLTHGPLAAQTVIKPRLALALFGAGVLEGVPASVLDGAGTVTSQNQPGNARPRGRFGWQSQSVSIRDQTTKAFAREMGLTTMEVARDGCTAAETDCLRQPSDGSPEVTTELVDAVVAFVRSLAVPAPSARSEQGTAGAALFATLGCTACHRAELPVELTDDTTGTKSAGVITPYTGLRLHDLGIEMADENAAGKKVPTRWANRASLGPGLSHEDRKSSDVPARWSREIPRGGHPVAHRRSSGCAAQLYGTRWALTREAAALARDPLIAVPLCHCHGLREMRPDELQRQ